MPKYKEYFKKMISDNQEFFDNFQKLHDEYALKGHKLQEKFNREGSKAMDFIREYENRLCANTERGKYNKFSAGLAEKFQKEVRKNFPMIDHVGLIVRGSNYTNGQKTTSGTIKFARVKPSRKKSNGISKAFTIKKIKLS
jgi:hypothetical protein